MHEREHFRNEMLTTAEIPRLRIDKKDMKMWMKDRRSLSNADERGHEIEITDADNDKEEENEEIDQDGEHLIIEDGSCFSEGSAIAWIAHDREFRKIAKEGSIDVEQGMAEQLLEQKRWQQ